MGLIIFLVIIVIAVVLHEFGHYMMARKCGVIADEFNIGMGPKICGKKWKGTMWNIRILPFGGSCVLDDNAMRAIKPIDRIKIFFAGPLMNAFLSVTFFVIGALIAQHYSIVWIVTNWAKNTAWIIPTFFTSFVTSLSTSAPTITESTKAMEGIIAEQETTRMAVAYICQLFFSMNAFLFIGNILPIPALDGGQILLDIPAVFNRPLSPKKVAVANFVFYILIMGVSAYYLLKDVIVTVIRT